MDLYNVRMRAAEGGAHELGGTHISGGERLVTAERLDEVVRALVQRAIAHEKGNADFINVKVERVASESVRRVKALPMRTEPVDTVAEGHAVAVRLLVEAGVSEQAAWQAVEWLKRGPAPDGDVMRGAIVMDADSGARLENDQARGVRVTGIDWHPDALAMWREQMQPLGIGSERIAEAVALATKVATTPGTAAELCWSDDPSYVTGYVASPSLGYVRIPHLKEAGSPLGGRVFFIKGNVGAEAYCESLQVPVLLI